MLVTHGVPSACPNDAPMRREAMQWSIQNWRMAGSALASVKPDADFGCEKHDGLKSTPWSLALAQSRQAAKCSGRSSSRSTRWPPVSAYMACRLRRCEPGSSL